MSTWSLDEDEFPRTSRRRERRQQRLLRQGEQEELNLVSMIDVFAVLVFFLLVSASVGALKLKVFGLDLPAPGAAMAAAPAPPVVRLLSEAMLVEIAPAPRRRLPRTAAGHDLAALSALLVQAKQLAPAQQQVTLLVDADVSYDEVVQVMETLRRMPAASRRIGLPTELFPKIALGDVERGT
ncbi:biopolymer transporter ExbD [Solimonas sp. SE-A11]|uniref:ExbD/TolR family protein n=1 Tax=Solimonas sp. SE-A11 TaxID=3054954 RepID=UPI00259D27E8|nr:biopolymer transporter ExbD [Solimonas sp. SE-A11]MDM4768736.1 biopolymer transporter ExbD [Solimonas sp. SE-A11]